MMTDSLPSEPDFDPCGNGLDEQSAWRNFGGLTLDEANKRFRECPEAYQEDFMWMGGRAFAFYFPVIDSFLRETTAVDEYDDRQAYILAHCIKMQFAGEVDPMVRNLAPRVLELATFVQANLGLFAQVEEDQSRIAGAWKELTESIQHRFNSGGRGVAPFRR